MAENEDGQIAGESFSQLLFAADDLGLDSDSYYNYTSSFSPQIPPKMLCFGDNSNKCEIATPPQKSGATCRNSSPASSTTNAPSKVNKKRNGSGKESVQSFVAGTGAPASSQRNCRKRKSENPTVGGRGHGKVKREKLGERITALQQLVSPYGKTDTASVLHEAMGYIRFLQEQVQVLSSPYLKTHPSSLSHFHHQEGGEEQPGKNDLRSRGLCLVPVESIAHVSSNNGADYWSPAAMGNHVSPNH
ncbi:transcription factor bHLH113 [Rhododendron vialii]|uniref:transcription factor bHLH113 n=1 Tax=Rhododendron vialii TaxID=182163 RepID=UPI00265EEDCE|nr:transcription factor bHLH113 [Rhododendron vialii]